MAAALALLLSLTAATARAESTQRLLKRMETIAERMDAAHPLERKAASERLNAFRSAFQEKGLVGARALALYLVEKRRPLRVRLHAAAFLATLKEPETYGALVRVAQDPEEPAGLRSTAVLAVGSLPVPAAPRRALFEQLIGPEHPGAVRREALGQLAALGTYAVAAVLSAAKDFGPAPEGLDRLAASHAASALAASPLPEAEGALYELLRHQKRGSPLRGDILTALSVRGPSYSLSRRDLEALTTLLFEPDENLATRAARFLARTRDARAVEALSRVLRTAQTPELLAQAAEALAAVGAADGGRAVLALRARLGGDPRFAGRDDAGRYAARIENAAAVFETAEPSLPRRIPGPAATLPFRYEGWPGEGRPVLVWTGKEGALALKKEPRRDAEAAPALPVAAGGSVPFDASLVVMRVAGLARAAKTGEFRAQTFGKSEYVSAAQYRNSRPVRLLRFKEGDRIETLAYRAGGNCFLRLPSNGEVFEGLCPKNTDFFQVLETPQTDWWLRTSGPEGVSGWFLSNAPGLEFRAREF